MRDVAIDLWLVLTTQTALEKAGLSDLMDDLNRRVVYQKQSWMRQLVLLDVREIARGPHMTNESRRRRYEETLFLAGY